MTRSTQKPEKKINLQGITLYIRFNSSVTAKAIIGSARERKKMKTSINKAITAMEECLHHKKMMETYDSSNFFIDNVLSCRKHDPATMMAQEFKKLLDKTCVEPPVPTKQEEETGTKSLDWLLGDMSDEKRMEKEISWILKGIVSEDESS